MPSTAKCPQCGIEMAVPADLVGGDVECPGCGRRFQSMPEPRDEEPERRPRQRRRFRRDDNDNDDFYRRSPADRREDALSKLKAPAIALIVVGFLRLIVSGLCAAGVGFTVPQAGFNPGTLFLLLLTGVSFVMIAIGLFASWKMLNARSYGWGLAAGILMLIPSPSLECYFWIFYVGFGVWALLIINDTDVRWLIRERQRDEGIMEKDSD